MKEKIGLVYLAAGISRRFNHSPKALQEVGKNNETLLECSLNQSLKAGFDKIHIIVSNKTESLFRKKFGDSYNEIPIEYTLQTFDPKERDKPWGQIDALCQLKNSINYPIVVCNADDLYGEQSFKILYNHLSFGNSEAASVWYPLKEVVPTSGTFNRGIFEEEKGYVKKIRETKAISISNLKERGLSLNEKCAMGIFALPYRAIDGLNNWLLSSKDKNKEDREKEFPFGEGLSDLIEEGVLKMKLYPSKSQWTGITNPGDEKIVRDYLDKY